MTCKTVSKQANLVSEVRRLVRARSGAPLELAERLWDLKQADPRAFSGLISEFSDQDGNARKRGLSRRRLLYLASIAEALPLAKYRSRFREIGWTKATVLAAFARTNGADDLGHLLDLAERHTVAELRVAIVNGELVDGMRCVQLRLTPDQYARFSEVLIQYGASPIAGRGLKGQEEALMLALQTAEPKQQP